MTQTAMVSRRCLCPPVGLPVPVFGEDEEGPFKDPNLEVAGTRANCARWSKRPLLLQFSTTCRSRLPSSSFCARVVANQMPARKVPPSAEVVEAAFDLVEVVAVVAQAHAPPKEAAPAALRTTLQVLAATATARLGRVAAPPGERGLAETTWCLLLTAATCDSSKTSWSRVDWCVRPSAFFLSFFSLALACGFAARIVPC